MFKSINIIPDLLRSRIAHRPNLVRIVDNVGWLFADKILRLGVGLFVGIWVARYLGPEQYGLLNYAMAFVALFGIFTTLGLQSIVVRDLVKRPEEAPMTVGTSMAIQMCGSIFAFALIIIAIRIARPDDPVAQALTLILGGGMLFNAFATTRYWFEAQVLSKYIVWVTSAVYLAMSVVRVALIYFEAPLTAFAWAVFADAALSGLFMVLVFSRLGISVRLLEASFSRSKKMLGDSWPLILSGIAAVIYLKIDIVMLSQIKNDQIAGIYSAAAKVSELWYLIPTTIVASVFPAILSANEKSGELYYRRLQQLFDLMVIISIAVALPLTFAAVPIMTVLFGEAYASSGPVLSVHIWAAIFYSLWIASGKWFVIENLQILSLQRALLGAFTNVALNFILIPKHGALGAAWATVVSYAVAAFFYDMFLPTTRHLFMMKLSALNVPKATLRLLGRQ